MIYWLMVLIAFGVSCQRVPDDESRVSVVNGEDLFENTSQAVAITKSDGFGRYYSFCSGVLIHPQFVLTAAHCSRASSDLTEYRVVSRAAFPEGDSEHFQGVARIITHPEFKPRALLKRQDGLFIPEKASDLAIWHLRDPIKSKFSMDLKIPSSVDSYLMPGAKFLVMGFGKKSPWQSDWVKAQLGQVILPFENESEQIALTFDESTGRVIKRSQKVLVNNRSGWEVFFGGQGHPDTCKGDSGGPVFFHSTYAKREKAELIAITSRGTSSCEGGGLYTLVAPYLPWIVKTIDSVESLSLSNL